MEWQHQAISILCLGKSLKLPSQKIEVDIPHFLFILSIFQTNIEKVSRIGVVMQWCTIMLKTTVFFRKQNVYARYDMLEHC
jgi:hypothetical protein